MPSSSAVSLPDQSSTPDAQPVIRWLGRVEYEPTWRAMQTFTNERNASTPDEIWFLEHPPVFTLGMNAAPEHLLAPGDIPVVQIDRGGQVTYHGPGQLVVYPLLDVRRAGLGVRQMVMALENAIIDLLASWNIAAVAKREAPGVYVNGRKVASIGLRIRRGSSYHGLAFNVAMDLQPFQRINPCGYRGLEVTDLRSLGVNASVQEVADALAPRLLASLQLTPSVG
nr:lipoyl(octanoyl) transferase LipB [uncultured Steroidobacter sp.]